MQCIIIQHSLRELHDDVKVFQENPEGIPVDVDDVDWWKFLATPRVEVVETFHVRRSRMWIGSEDADVMKFPLDAVKVRKVKVHIAWLE